MDEYTVDRIREIAREEIRAYLREHAAEPQPGEPLPQGYAPLLIAYAEWHRIFEGRP